MRTREQELELIAEWFKDHEAKLQTFTLASGAALGVLDWRDKSGRSMYFVRSYRAARDFEHQRRPGISRTPLELDAVGCVELARRGRL